MTQYCRYCSFLVVGDANYCSEHNECYSDRKCKSANRCKDFNFNPIDAFGENEKGYQPRVRKPKQNVRDGQMSLNLEV